MSVRLILALLAVIAAAHSSACDVPLYRFALEQWIPEGYLVQVMHRKSLTTEQQALLEQLRTRSYDPAMMANIGVQDVDLSDKNTDPAVLASVSSLGDEPQLIVSYPQRQQVEHAAWKAPLNAESIAVLLDSPARRELAKRLLAGDSAVWLIIEGDDRREVDGVESRIKDVGRSCAEMMNQIPSTPGEPRVKTAFSVLRISADDPAETFLVAQIRNRFASEENAAQSLAAPIFGRGRALCAEPLSKWTESEIMSANNFLCSPCSCIVQDSRPGVELAMKANWAITGPVMVVEQKMPPLSGFEQPIASKQTPPPPTVPEVTIPLDPSAVSAVLEQPPYNEPAAISTPQEVSAPRASGGLGLLLAAAVVTVGIATVFILLRK
jgi:hypothetical protein